jgi:hypothetical protein
MDGGPGNAQRALKLVGVPSPLSGSQVHNIVQQVTGRRVFSVFKQQGNQVAYVTFRNAADALYAKNQCRATLTTSLEGTPATFRIQWAKEDRRLTLVEYIQANAGEDARRLLEEEWTGLAFKPNKLFECDPSEPDSVEP